MNNIKAFTLGTAVVLALFFFWYTLSPPSGHKDSRSTQNHPQIGHLQNRISALEDALFEAQLKTRELSERVAQLEKRQGDKIDKPDLSPAQQALADEDLPTASGAGHPVKILKRPPTLQQKLLAAGLPEDTVQRIHQRIGENRLALLELRNRAIREDWMDTPEYIEQMQQLRNPAAGIREQEGDDVYDQYLYAAGRPNRVMVSEVYSGSAAEQAGIQPHDVILSYAQDRIFSMRELQRATTEGIDGEIVLVELYRDGQRLSTSVARGPLGIALTVTRLPPQ